MEMRVNRAVCTGCGICIPICPVGAISLVESVAEINQSVCTLCQKCVEACPSGAISSIKLPTVVKPGVKQTPSGLEVMRPIPPSSIPKQSISSTAAYAGLKILPRLVDIIVSLFKPQFYSQPESMDNHLQKTTRGPSLGKGKKYRRRTGRR